MVVSQIDSSIQYPEIKDADPKDIGFDATLYEIELKPKLFGTIALGNIRYAFIDKGVLYVPVYLVEDGEVSSQIGVYEFFSSDYTNLLDEDNDLDISLLSNPVPLYYAFASDAFLKQHAQPQKPASEGGEDEFKEAESDAEDSLSVEQESEEMDSVLKDITKDDDDLDEPDETITEDIEQRKKYKARTTHTWIQKFMRNTHYSLIDNEGKGDCLFATIRDAFKGIKDITVADLRKMVSNTADQQVFDTYKEQFDMYVKLILTSRKEMKKIAAEVGHLKKEKAATRDRDKAKAIIMLAKKKVEDFNRLKRERVYAQEIIQDFKFMHNVKTLAQFKSKIKECSFWADTWAINTLERMLNIKIIVLSRRNYLDGDIANVLLCGNMVDPEIEKKGVFKPRYYIIVDYLGDHYILVTYKNKRIFRFSEIPYTIKQMIVEKCMETAGGIYNYIPKFKKMREAIHPPQSPELGEDKSKDPSAPSQGKDASPDEDTPSSKDTEISVHFDPTTVFQFYSRSASKPKPGKGSGETIKPENQAKFAELAGYKNWRRILSNFADTPFDLDGHPWKAVEMFYQGSKFKKGHPEFYLKFALDSGSEIAKNAAMAKAAGGETGKFKGALLRPKSITMDADFFTSGRAQKAMKEAQEAKYTQNRTAQKILLATKDAKLQHYSRGQPPIVFTETMAIRDDLQKGDEKDEKDE